MKPIPVAKPYLGKEEDWAVAEVLQSGNLTTGWKVQEFEEAFSEYLGVGHSVACNSATSGLQIAWQIEKECWSGQIPSVICPAYSFIATANAIVNQGLKPSFDDICLQTYNLEETRFPFMAGTGFMPVHQMGLIFDQSAVRLIQDAGYPVVEDAACAVGTWYKYGEAPMNHFAVFSFHPRKIMTTAEGGMIVTDNKEKADRARELISHAPGGYNYRLTDIQAAVGLVQLKKLVYIIPMRWKVIDLYEKSFREIDEIIEPYPSAACQSYQVRVPHRDKVLVKLHEAGVMATKGIQAIHRNPFYAGDWDLPNTELAADTSIIMPLFPDMTKEEVIYCAETLIKVVRRESDVP